jgi:hypothetical protein
VASPFIRKQWRRGLDAPGHPREQDERRTQDRFLSTLVISASIIATVPAVA